jgi:hypothetical protein
MGIHAPCTLSHTSRSTFLAGGTFLLTPLICTSPPCFKAIMAFLGLVLRRETFHQHLSEDSLFLPLGHQFSMCWLSSNISCCDFCSLFRIPPSFRRLSTGHFRHRLPMLMILLIVFQIKSSPFSTSLISLHARVSTF